MSEIVKYLGQEWCNPKNINLKQSGYITKGGPDGLMVLCAVEQYERRSVDENAVSSMVMGTRHRPLRYEDLNLAEE